MIHSLILLALVSIAATTISTAQNDSIIIGKTYQKVLNQLPWFTMGQIAYQPTAVAITGIAQYAKDIKIIAFGGSWCSDTHELLPPFYKVARLAGIKASQITLYLVDRAKKLPKSPIDKYHITRVPTFIIFQNNKEVGRIEETVKQSIEEDLLQILQHNQH